MLGPCHWPYHWGLGHPAQMSRQSLRKTHQALFHQGHLSYTLRPSPRLSQDLRFTRELPDDDTNSCVATKPVQNDSASEPPKHLQQLSTRDGTAGVLPSGRTDGECSPTVVGRAGKGPLHHPPYQTESPTTGDPTSPARLPLLACCGPRASAPGTRSGHCALEGLGKSARLP